ncbi:TPM domain-containing protein [Bordetella holmesii]|uniref:PF04536 family protein n=2 Tax=Bordetella holmesii TaxID=35814 RepID=A0A158M7Y9_9BORD|nr:YgcG family protein [Bordetella holmesii]EWM50952.1 repair family protein [Bordetella holmesii 70147]AMD49299.1 hypothetical protein F783_011115 [Bordetella holmesii F627]AWP65562.1 hypothetical protein B7O97_00760 [Bordetella holmesii]AWP91657.1 hypothetical protein B7O96_00755 [Bordetella holmesii]EXF89816.1 repair family protein [Bordetella holmesii 30539]
MNRASRKPWWAVLGWALACLLWLVTPVQAQQAKEVAVPTLSKRVTDLTSTLDASQQAALETKLAALEQRKGAQVAVLIVPTTGPDTIEQFATRVFDTWKLGRQKVDDGILFVVAKNDHTLRFEVGYGLEGAVPDAMAARIIREQVVPHFKRDDYAAGIEAGVDSLTKLIDGEPLPAAVASAGRDSGSSGFEWGDLLDVGLFLLVLLIAAPPILGALVAGVAAGIMSGSLLMGGIAAVIVGGLSFLLGVTGLKKALVSRGGRGGRGGGGFGGGGGRSGGGGASGRW